MVDTAIDGPTPEFVAKTAETALGPVEYAVVGTGTPVVVLHTTRGRDPCTILALRAPAIHPSRRWRPDAEPVRGGALGTR